MDCNAAGAVLCLGGEGRGEERGRRSSQGFGGYGGQGWVVGEGGSWLVGEGLLLEEDSGWMRVPEEQGL